MQKIRIIRTSTVPVSLKFLLKGQLSFLNRYFDVSAVSGEGPDLDVVREREGVTVFPVKMERKISPYRDLVSLIKLFFLFKRTKPQIVHSITPKAGLLSMTAAKFAGVPIRMHTFTGLIFPSKTGFMQQLLILMDRILCRFATNIYPEGKGVKEDLINFRITDKPLKIIANGNVNGIDLDYFDGSLLQDEVKKKLRQELGIGEDDFVFIFVGRLVKDKGINELIRAFKNMKNSSFDSQQKAVKLLLVGPFEAELDPLLPETLQEMHVNNSVISVGFQEDVRPYFGIADALVFPSYREGFPNVVMQAGAMELPAIVTNINGCNEIIEDSVNGIIIPSRSSHALQESMEKLSSNPVFYLKLKEKARELIVERYNQSLVWISLKQEYETLISLKAL